MSAGHGVAARQQHLAGALHFQIVAALLAADFRDFRAGNFSRRGFQSPAQPGIFHARGQGDGALQGGAQLHDFIGNAGQVQQHQLFTVGEAVLAHAFQRSGQLHIGELSAAQEGGLAQGGQGTGQAHGLQLLTVLEGGAADGGHALPQDHQLDLIPILRPGRAGGNKARHVPGAGDSQVAGGVQAPGQSLAAGAGGCLLVRRYRYSNLVTLIRPLNACFPFRDGTGEINLLQVLHAVKGIHADALDGVGKPQPLNSGAVVERAIADGQHAPRQNDLLDAGASGKDVLADVFHGRREHQSARKTAAAMEGIVAQAHQAAGNVQRAGQLCAIEGVRADGRNAIRQVDRGKAAAFLEGFLADGRNAIRQVDRGKAAAFLEGFLADGRNAIREADRSQIIAEPEGPLADGFQATRDLDALQRIQVHENFLVNGLHAACDQNLPQSVTLIKSVVPQTGHIPLDLYRLQTGIVCKRSIAYLGYTGGNDQAGKIAAHQGPILYRLQALGKLDFRQAAASGKRTTSQRFQRLGKPDLLELPAIQEGTFVKAYQVLRKGHLLEIKAVGKSADTGDPLPHLQPQDLSMIIPPRYVFTAIICCYGSGTGEDQGAVGGKYPGDVGAVCLRAAGSLGENILLRQQFQDSLGGLLGGIGRIGRIGGIGSLRGFRGFRGFRFLRGVRHLRHFRGRRRFRGRGSFRRDRFRGFRGLRGFRVRGLGGRLRHGHLRRLLQLYSGSRGVLRQDLRQSRSHQLARQHQSQQQGEQFFHKVTFPFSDWLFPDVRVLVCIPIILIILVSPGNCKNFFVKLYRF